jgi:TM2 domain-containing membrane protein YozV
MSSLAISQHEVEVVVPDRSSSGTAFLLWLACALGLCGIHRFYLGKPISGILYLLTFGVFGIGQLVDLFLLRGMVRESNGRQLAETSRRRMLPPARSRPASTPVPTRSDAALRSELFRAASRQGGGLSLAQAVAATGRTEREVELVLDQLAVEGAAELEIDSGTVVYRFEDLRRG